MFTIAAFRARVLDSAALFPDAERFTAQWRQIREEALTVAHDLHNIPRFHEIMIQQESISANDARLAHVHHEGLRPADRPQRHAARRWRR